MTSATISNWSFRLGSNASPQVLTSIEEVTEVGGLGSENALVRVTNFDSPNNDEEYIAGPADGVEFSVTCNFVAGAAGQLNAMAAQTAKATRLFELRFTGSSPERVWSGRVVCRQQEVGPSTDSANSYTFGYKISGNLTVPTS